MANFDDFLNFILFGSGVGWICAGIYVAKPNLHGIKFKEGTCNITSVETISIWSDLPTCSCGKGCSEQYPCVTVRGYFWNNSSNNASSPVAGTFHKDFKAIQKKCLYVPDCKKKFTENNELVYKYYIDHVDAPYPFWSNRTFYNLTRYNDFSCWGHEDTMYFDHSYTIVLVYISLIIPGLIFLAALIGSLVCGSDSQREFIGGLFILPFLIIGGLLACIWEILSELFPRSCVDGAERCCDGFGDCIRSSIRCECFSVKSGDEPEPERDNEVDRYTNDRSRRSSLGSISLSGGSLVLSEGHISSPSRVPRLRRSSLPSEVRLSAPSDLPPSVGVSFDVPPSGPVTYEVRGSDVLPPPPSYDEVVSSNIPTRAAPSYEDVVNKSF